MAEGYLVGECLTFVSHFLDITKTRKVHGGPENQEGNSRPLYGATVVRLNHDELDKAHQWIIFNSDSFKSHIK